MGIDLSQWRVQIGLYYKFVGRTRAHRGRCKAGAASSSARCSPVLALTMVFCLITAPSLLLQAGDVERNPGPGPPKTEDGKEPGAGRQLFDQAMKDGYVEARNIKVLFLGAAGAGKTSLKATILGLPPPVVRVSTAMAERPVRTVIKDDGEWLIMGPEDVKEELAAAIQTAAMAKVAEADQGDDSSSATAVVHSGSIARVTWVYLLDTGGQPQFHEVFRAFLKRASLCIFVQKLSERFDEYPIVEYYDQDGKLVSRPYRTAVTHQQIMNHCVQTMLPHDSREGKVSAPKIVVVGTHVDKEDQCSETREAKNQKLIDLLDNVPTFRKQVVYYGQDMNQVIFPLNTQCPGKAEKEVAKQIQEVILRECVREPDKIPLSWYALEQALQELARKCGRDVLTKEECFTTALQLDFNEESFEAALQYLHDLNIIFYYHSILPEFVFCNPQVLLDTVTDLVKFSNRLKWEKTKSAGFAMVRSWHKFEAFGLITVGILGKFYKHYNPGIFSPEHIIKLFKHLLILADLNDTEYLMPSLLQTLEPFQLIKHRLSCVSACAPLVVFFPDGPPLGLFCSLVVFLLSQENRFPTTWKLQVKPSGNPTYVNRNCVNIVIPGVPGSVTLFDSVEFFEIHVCIPSELLPQICPMVRNAVFSGLESASIVLDYGDEKPLSAVLCPCNKSSSHPATISRDQSWWICSRNSVVFGKLQDKHRLWLLRKAQLMSGDTLEASAQHTASGPRGAVSISSQQSLSDLPYKDYVAAFGRFFCVGFSVRDNIRKAVFDLKNDVITGVALSGKNVSCEHSREVRPCLVVLVATKEAEEHPERLGLVDLVTKAVLSEIEKCGTQYSQEQDPHWLWFLEYLPTANSIQPQNGSDRNGGAVKPGARIAVRHKHGEGYSCGTVGLFVTVTIECGAIRKSYHHGLTSFHVLVSPNVKSGSETTENGVFRAIECKLKDRMTSFEKYSRWTRCCTSDREAFMPALSFYPRLLHDIVNTITVYLDQSVQAIGTTMRELGRYDFGVWMNLATEQCAGKGTQYEKIDIASFSADIDPSRGDLCTLESVTEIDPAIKEWKLFDGNDFISLFSDAIKAEGSMSTFRCYSYNFRNGSNEICKKVSIWITEPQTKGKKAHPNLYSLGIKIRPIDSEENDRFHDGDSGSIYYYKSGNTGTVFGMHGGVDVVRHYSCGSFLNYSFLDMIKPELCLKDLEQLTKDSSIPISPEGRQNLKDNLKRLKEKLENIERQEREKGVGWESCGMKFSLEPCLNACCSQPKTAGTQAPRSRRVCAPFYEGVKDLHLADNSPQSQEDLASELQQPQQPLLTAEGNFSSRTCSQMETTLETTQDSSENSEGEGTLSQSPPSAFIAESPSTPLAITENSD